jgi:3-methyladenine DNA glycosylase AlkD
MSSSALKRALRAYADPKKAIIAKRFFKTGPGQYGEGDIFLGLTVPETRSVAKEFRTASLDDLATFIESPIHEERLLALLILVDQYTKADDTQKKKIVNFYKKHLKGVNNWDLVDSSADKILGAYCYETGDTAILDTYAASKDLWKQRIAMVATFYFIRKHQFEPTLRIAETLLYHQHDLIHKAVGWMLREMGKKDAHVLHAFLKKHHRTMPRTMLRYAIEKFDAETRAKYMAKKTEKSGTIHL